MTASALVGTTVDPNGNSLDVFTNMSLDDIANVSQTVPSNLTISLVPELMKYYIGCALESGQYWNMTYNGTSYHFEGILGLAPSVTEPPTPEQARWLSACLMARVNHFEKEIFVSLRGTELETTPEEEAEFQIFEGAFFGDLFSTPQQKFACEGTPKTLALSASVDRQWRICTDASENCYFTVVGQCSDVCSISGPCTVNGTVYNEVIEVYLYGSTSNSTTNYSGSVALKGASVFMLMILVLLFLHIES
jgi:hypothetical protein